MLPWQRTKFARDILISYPTRIDIIVGATIFVIPRSIRQDDLLSDEVLKALDDIPSSERAKAVRGK